MDNNIDCIALHEAGHAVAHLLAGMPFEYVTIKENIRKDESGYRSLGHVANQDAMTPEEWENHSILDPAEFAIFFKDDFTKVAGLVAEAIYSRKPNYTAAKEDFRQWVGTSLIKLQDRLESRYIDFLLEYTYQVLHEKKNWSSITAVALALIDEETLSYKRVFEVIEQNHLSPLIS